MRKQNSTFKTAFISEAGSGLENNDYFAFVELEKYACYVIADGLNDLPDAESARLATQTAGWACSCCSARWSTAR